jgi:hypothetical protein
MSSYAARHPEYGALLDGSSQTDGTRRAQRFLDDDTLALQTTSHSARKRVAESKNRAKIIVLSDTVQDHGNRPSWQPECPNWSISKFLFLAVAPVASSWLGIWRKQDDESKRGG